MTYRWFSPGPPVSSTNKTNRHDIVQILLKVALSTIKPTNQKKSHPFLLLLRKNKFKACSIALHYK
jgi:hypothetical protein